VGVREQVGVLENQAQKLPVAPINEMAQDFEARVAGRRRIQRNNDYFLSNWQSKLKKNIIRLSGVTYY